MVATNIHPASGLLSVEPEHMITFEPMTLAAACRAMGDTVPYFAAVPQVCGCGRCGR